MLFKKENTPNPSDVEKALGVKRFILVEELTPASYKKLRELSLDERVERVWSAGGHLRFILREDKSLRLVKSVFESVDYIVEHSKIKPKPK